jgi:hypothetical protein
VTGGTVEFKQYRRSQVAEMTAWVPGFDMTRVSLTEADREAGSPKAGDMIARNPKNHDDRWLVAAAYFADNFEPLTYVEATTPHPGDESGLLIPADVAASLPAGALVSGPTGPDYRVPVAGDPVPTPAVVDVYVTRGERRLHRSGVTWGLGRGMAAGLLHFGDVKRVELVNPATGEVVYVADSSHNTQRPERTFRVGTLTFERMPNGAVVVHGDGVVLAIPENEWVSVVTEMAREPDADTHHIVERLHTTPREVAGAR